MDELLEILEDIKPNVDFKTCTDLIDGGYLDSFDTVSYTHLIGQIHGDGHHHMVALIAVGFRILDIILDMEDGHIPLGRYHLCDLISI